MESGKLLPSGKKKELFDVRGTDVEIGYLQRNPKVAIETPQ